MKNHMMFNDIYVFNWVIGNQHLILKVGETDWVNTFFSKDVDRVLFL